MATDSQLPSVPNVGCCTPRSIQTAHRVTGGPRCGTGASRGNGTVSSRPPCCMISQGPSACCKFGLPPLRREPSHKTGLVHRHTRSSRARAAEARAPPPSGRRSAPRWGGWWAAASVQYASSPATTSQPPRWFETARTRSAIAAARSLHQRRPISSSLCPGRGRTTGVPSISVIKRPAAAHRRSTARCPAVSRPSPLRSRNRTRRVRSVTSL